MGTVEPPRLAQGSAQALTAAVRVVPDVSGIDKTFDYAVPDRFGVVDVGSIVRVELNGRRVDAWVIAHPDTAGSESYQLKDILDVLSVGPAADVVELARWCSRRFSGPLRAVLGVASPPKRVKVLKQIKVDQGVQPAKPVPKSMRWLPSAVGSSSGRRVGRFGHCSSLRSSLAALSSCARGSLRHARSPVR